jgi:Kelch motif
MPHSCFFAMSAVGGVWQSLTNQPQIGINTMVLLTDGTVLCRGDDNTAAGGRQWLRLTPTAAGTYVDGLWSPAAPSSNSRRYYASAVLADGTVLVAGGEESDGGADLNAAELYDPTTDTWKTLPTPSGWTAIGDAPCCVLADGRVLLGSILTKSTAVYDPIHNSWSPAGDKDDRSDEETWTLLPDGTVLTVECDNHPKAEKFVPSQNRWLSAGLVPVDLVQASSSEIGPAVLMADGRVFALGATGHTALYSCPPTPDLVGTWLAGPDLPRDANGVQLITKDAPAALLPNGHVLFATSPLAEGSVAKGYPGPSHFFEFDGHAFTAVAAPGTSGSPAYAFRLLLLPNGQVLAANGTSDLEIYTPDGSPDPAWAPRIVDCPKVISAGATYCLQGTQLNGLSQAVSYGDDATMATNYPLVRLVRTNPTRTWYCRTHGHTTMGVATGSAIVTTTFDVPEGVEDGAAQLEVVSNGIPSEPVTITLGPTPVVTNGSGRPPRTGCLARSSVAVSLVGVVLIVLARILT